MRDVVAVELAGGTLSADGACAVALLGMNISRVSGQVFRSGQVGELGVGCLDLCLAPAAWLAGTGEGGLFEGAIWWRRLVSRVCAGRRSW